MIADNLIYWAVFVFIVLVIGLVLTVLEFRHGEPRRQQEAADKNPAAFADLKDRPPAR
jgi:hypothetical protein